MTIEKNSLDGGLVAGSSSDKSSFLKALPMRGWRIREECNVSNVRLGTVLDAFQCGAEDSPTLQMEIHWDDDSPGSVSLFLAEGGWVRICGDSRGFSIDVQGGVSYRLLPPPSFNEAPPVGREGSQKFWLSTWLAKCADWLTTRGW